MNDDILRKKTTGETGNGGEFGTHNRAEADISLADIDETFTARKTLNNGVYYLASDQTDPPAVKTDFGYSQVVTIGGLRHTNARSRAIAAQITEEQRFDAEGEANKLADANEKMTLLAIPRTAGPVRIYEGTGTRSLRPMLMAKASRSKGWMLDDINIVAVKKGYGGVQALTDYYNELSSAVPSVDPVDFEGVPSSDDNDGSEEPPNEIAAVYLVDGPDFGAGSTAGCLWLVTDTQDNGAIANGYFWAPDGGTSFSEHGSISAEDLAKRGGRIRDYKPGLTFEAVMNGVLGGDRKSAYSAILNPSN